ncbi:beta-glucosidase [Flexivirga caeni]|uniref:Exo-alpha-(1->6)-L-arabinopyranosidase n=1 Tax=Flexivirga caeni TaxID=2294115 RepID=A0A3M9LZV9_9MICO|nr:glycoside hydrolase family 3 C-terminal domain-containing protein [Flexivirga caeni]RNI17888.1 beta-glucosidase [Flexivirga caeni]
MPPSAPIDLAGIPLAVKAGLLVGKDFWTTMDAPEYGVGSVRVSDGPHGVRSAEGEELGLNAASPATCFPPAVAVGCSWDPQVAHRIGETVAREARSLGVDIVLGPGINIKRSPLCGRNFEYYSEDPHLSGELGMAHVQGQQGAGVGASVKHFAANNQETERMRVDVIADERTLREIYLSAFETVVKQAAPATVMASYNLVGGLHATENPWLLTTVLREEWGYAGAVVSDWGATCDPVASVAAGLDLQMPGRSQETIGSVVAAVEDGRLAEDDLDRAVGRVLSLRDWVAEPTGSFDVEAHHRVARETAASCAVLLKNDDAALPLGKAARIAVIGEFARTPRYQGGGSSHINATRVDAALDAMREIAGNVDFAAGFTLDGSGDAAALRDEAVRLAADSEVAVIFAGLPDAAESEGFDRTGLSLPADQIALIRAVAAAAPRTVVVLSHGGIVTVEEWHEQVDAILDCSLLGQAGGGATADLLFGVVNPSGHLAESVPRELRHTTAYLNFPGDHLEVRYGEGVFVGYRGYETTGTQVRYPFGHGLSYTTFTTSALRVAATGEASAIVRLTVANTGSRAGRHVVQVYVGSDAGPVHRPARELRAFRSVWLEAGESREITLTLDDRAFAYWDVTDHAWVVPAGDYRVEIGVSSHEICAAQTISLAGNQPVRPLSRTSSVDEWLDHPSVGPMLVDALAGYLPEKDAAMIRDDPAVLRIMGSMEMAKAMRMFGVGDAIPALDELIARSA